MTKRDSKVYKTIGEVAKELQLIDKKKGKLQTHVIRFWETQFKQIKPTIKAGRRRYYSDKDLSMIKKVKFLLKDKGLTIKGAKKILDDTNADSNRLDANNEMNINTNLVDTKDFKHRLVKISKLISDLRKIK